MPDPFLDVSPLNIRADDHAMEAFERAFVEYKDAIFRHCYFHTYKRERALELMQDAFMKTWEYIAAGNDIENVRAFLYRVATNLVYNDSRKKETTSLEDLQEQGFDPGTEDEELKRDPFQEKRVMEIIQKLDEPYRQVVTLRYIEELGPAEIAEILGESPNTVSVRLHRGLKQLRSYLIHG